MYDKTRQTVVMIALRLNKKLYGFENGVKTMKLNLDEIRKQINEKDNQLEKLFLERMTLCKQVAQYKIDNNMPVFQSAREGQIIDRVRQQAEDEYKDSVQTLFTAMIDISKFHQYHLMLADKCNMQVERLDLSGKYSVAIPGTAGSYCHKAALKLFANCEEVFFADFEEVCSAVNEGKLPFGILPIENSTAGIVSQTYNLLKNYDVKIACTTKIKVEHCLAVRKGTRFEDIEKVFSHSQALHQCSNFISENNFKTKEMSNTSIAGDFVSESEKPYAAICSAECAERLGLEILSREITDTQKNYTRFILISKTNYWSEYADIVSVALRLPHTPSALYRLLTKFSVAGLNLVKIESMPIASTDFDVLFYLDFNGSISDKRVTMLVKQLEMEMSEFKFLGNYFET